MRSVAGVTRHRVGGPERGAGRFRLREWLFPLALTVGIWFLVFTPYFLATRCATQDQQFMGLVGRDAIDDNNVYLGLMRQAAEGGTLFTNNFTPEPNRPALFNFLYLSLGRLSRFTGWSLDRTHQFFMAFSILLLVLSIYSFVGQAIRDPRYRRLALVLACFGGGFLWLSRLLFRTIEFGFRPIDAYLVELNLFHAMMVYPHFVFAGALLVSALALFLKAEREGRYRPVLVAGIGGAVLTASHAFETVVLLPVIFAYLLLDWWAKGSWPNWGSWRRAAVVAGCTVPVLGLNAWILSHEPMWGNVVERLDFYTPGPHRLLLGLGASFLIAAITFEGFLRRGRSAGERMAKAWLVVALILAYTPGLNWRWHLLNGIQIPLAVLTVQGLRRTAFLWLRRRRGRPYPAWWRRLFPFPLPAAATSLLIIICCLSSANHFLNYRTEATQVARPTYLPRGQVMALEWMRDQLPVDALVFCSYGTGNYVPRLAGQRVFLGEDKLTENYDERVEQELHFFGDGWDDSQRWDLLGELGVSYLFYGPEERRLGDYEPDRSRFLSPVYDRDGVKIFRVEKYRMSRTGARVASRDVGSR